MSKHFRVASSLNTSRTQPTTVWEFETIIISLVLINIIVAVFVGIICMSDGLSVLKPSLLGSFGSFG